MRATADTSTGLAIYRLTTTGTNMAVPIWELPDDKELDEEFQAIHKFSIAVYALSHPDEFPDVWDDMPIQWTREFATMAHMWARLTEIAEFGGSVSERYAGGPQSCRRRRARRCPRG